MRALCLVLALAACSQPEPTVRIETNATPSVEPLKVVCSRNGEVAIFYRNDDGREFGPVVTGERCRYRDPR